MKKINVFLLCSGAGSIAFGYATFRLGSLIFDPYWRHITPDKTVVSVSLFVSMALFLIFIRHFLSLATGHAINTVKPSASVDLLKITDVIKVCTFPFVAIAYCISLMTLINLSPGVFGIVLALIGGYIYTVLIPSINKRLTAKMAGMLACEK